MIGELTPAEIDSFLKTQSIARIGCHTDGKTYVVPITYAYDNNAFIGHSAEGLKIWMMRANRNVCVEVDSMSDPGNWTCVIGQGHFEELSGEEAVQAMNTLKQRFADVLASATALPHHGAVDHPVAFDRKKNLARNKPVIYRISLREKSGRFERSALGVTTGPTS